MPNNSKKTFTAKPATGRIILYYDWDELFNSYKVRWMEIKAVLRSGKILTFNDIKIEPKAVVDIINFESFEETCKIAKSYPSITSEDYNNL